MSQKENTTIQLTPLIKQAAKMEHLNMSRILEDRLKEILQEKRPDVYNFNNGYEANIMRLQLEQKKAEMIMLETQLAETENKHQTVVAAATAAPVEDANLIAEERKILELQLRTRAKPKAQTVDWCLVEPEKRRLLNAKLHRPLSKEEYAQLVQEVKQRVEKKR